MNPSFPELKAEDFVRSSDLARRGQPGEPGAHWVARGLLTETCTRLLGRPLSLGYQDYPQAMTVISVHLSLASTVLSTDRADAVVAVKLLMNRDTGRWG